MDTLDFLSESPKLYIFKNNTNKTFIGGLFFLLYIIVMVFISLIYIFDYALNEKYSYEALTFYNHTEGPNVKDEMNKDDELNPYLNFTIDLKKDNFAIYDYKNVLSPSPIEMNKAFDSERGSYIYNFKKKVTDIYIIIYFLCGKDKDCNLAKENRTNNYGNVFIKIPDHTINHEADPPVNENTSKTLGIPIQKIGDKVRYINYEYEWEVIKYQDKKSLLDIITKEKKEFVFGHIKGQKISYNDYEVNNNRIIKYIDGLGYVLSLLTISFTNDHENYIYYKREKVSFLDVIANIGAMFSTVQFFFSIVLSFYSNNFNNYTIIQKILNTSKESTNDIEVTSDMKLTDLDKEETKNVNNNIDKDKTSPSINKVSGNNNNHKRNESNKYNFFTLKNLCCCEFFLNNCYFKCCNKCFNCEKCNKYMNNQELINNANDIVSKYLSIELLVNTQIKLENLFKDYNWNNPDLENIYNNKRIIKLKKQ